MGHASHCAPLGEGAEFVGQVVHSTPDALICPAGHATQSLPSGINPGGQLHFAAPWFVRKHRQRDGIPSGRLRLLRTDTDDWPEGQAVHEDAPSEEY